jgi:hypothetical protein
MQEEEEEKSNIRKDVLSRLAKELDKKKFSNQIFEIN